MRRRLNTAFLIGLLALFAWITFRIVEPFLDFVIGGLLLTFVFYPLYERIQARVRYRPLASLLVILIIVIIVVFPMFFAVWSLVQDLQQISGELTVAHVQDFFVQLDEAIAQWTGFDILAPDNQTAAPGNQTGEPPPGDGNATGNDTHGGLDPNQPIIRHGLFAPGDLTRIIVPRLTQIGTELVTQAIGFIFKAFLGVFVMAFIMYYGFKDGRQFVRFIFDALPLRETYKNKLFEEIQEVVDAVFIGQILVSLVQGVLGGIGFWAFGLPNPVFWGFIMTILAILPIIGTPIVWVPWGLYSIAVGDTFAGVGIIVYGLLIVSTVDNFLKPKIIGDRAEIHPAIVLLGVVGGLAVFGFIGFLLGPLVLAIFTVLLKLFKDDFVAREELNVPGLGRLD